MKGLFYALSCLVLVGCASLPIPDAQHDRYIAVVLAPGKFESSIYGSANFYLTTESTSRPVRLTTGTNYIPVNSDATFAELRAYTCSANFSNGTFTIFDVRPSKLIRPVEAGTITLVPLLLSYHSQRYQNGYQLIGTVDPLPQDKIDRILADWQKDKNAPKWNKLIVADQ